MTSEKIRNQKLEALGVTGYKRLIVWQKSHSLVKDVLAVAQSYPDEHESKIIRNQTIRAVTSIPANIAEGYGGLKGGNAYRNYLIISRRSTYETGYWLLLSYELGYLSVDQYYFFANKISEVAAMLRAIINKLGKKSESVGRGKQLSAEAPGSSVNTLLTPDS